MARSSDYELIQRLNQSSAARAPQQSGTRPVFAGDIFGLVLDPSTYTSWKGAIGRRMPLGRFGVGGLGLAAGGVGGLMAAGNELNNPDPTVSNAQRIAGAAGAGLGTAAGTTLGAVLGGMTPLGPLGAAVGGFLGGQLGAGAGSLARAGVGLFEASPEQKALAAFQRQADAQTEAEAKRMLALLPIQERAAKFASDTEIERMRQMQTIQSMADAYRNQQLASAQQAALTTQGLFSGLGFS